MSVRVLEYISEHGRSRYKILCSCGAHITAYVWSLYGTGKRCPCCGRKIRPSDIEPFEIEMEK